MRKETPTVDTRPTASAGPPTHRSPLPSSPASFLQNPKSNFAFSSFSGSQKHNMGHPVPTPSLTLWLPPHPLSFLNKQITSPSQVRGDVTLVHRHSHLIKRPHGLQHEFET